MLRSFLPALAAGLLCRGRTVSSRQPTAAATAAAAQALPTSFTPAPAAESAPEPESEPAATPGSPRSGDQIWATERLAVQLLWNLAGGVFSAKGSAAAVLLSQLLSTIRVRTKIWCWPD